ncbi:hypothetical protein [Deminuibacter soli]|uniref:Uncharacterized protein n=1 Tax=Deminuibacter soli TaxID=2291815 RepID=A0A3E1NIW9_9BACT|nr:hypothetical protein [Deminuibacter soli]RFM27877.1 hypothetical protein DXN05_14385 [Deminuibacter soli]
MNIALGAFILTLLFLPAISFRMSVNREENLKELLGTLSFTDSIWVFSLIPIFIHVLLLLTLFIFGLYVKFDLILNILYSNKDFPIDNRVFGHDVLSFLAYCFVAILTGYLLGLLVNRLELRYGWITRLLGLGNEWYEVFEGIVFNENGERQKTASIDVTYVSVLSNTKESTVIYSGILVNYYYKPRSTELDYLVLQQATRRDLRKEHVNQGARSRDYYSAKTGQPVPIPGEYFIVPMSQVLNINVSYLSIVNGNGVKPAV